MAAGFVHISLPRPSYCHYDSQYWHDLLITELSHNFDAMFAARLEFDAGVIALEMQRAGFEDDLIFWADIATHGFCTMNPHITSWACAELVEETHMSSVLGRRRPICIKDMVRGLLPTQTAMLTGHHDAGIDAQMVWFVVQALHDQLRRARVNACS